jgi:hypothetical protein
MRGEAISEREALGGERVPDSEEDRWIQNTRVILEGAAGLAAGMVVIGRYNQTAVLISSCLAGSSQARSCSSSRRPAVLSEF